MMYVNKDKETFEVLTTIKEPKTGDKWEDKEYLYTITDVQRLYISQVPMYTAAYYIVNVDVWCKVCCCEDEPQRFLFKYDLGLEVSDKDIEKRKEDILKSDIAMQNAELLQDALWQLENELAEERIKNEDFHDYAKIYEE